VLRPQGWMLMSSRDRAEAEESLARERRLRGPVVASLGSKAP
jgi:hypothetical protein